MTTSKDPSTSRLEHVVEVYDTPDESRDPGYLGLSRTALGLAGGIAVAHAVTLLAGYYVVAIGLLLVALVGVGMVAAEARPDLGRS